MNPPFLDRPPALSVCLDLSPSHGGLYRAVIDLAQAAGSPILSFRDGTGRVPPGNVGAPLKVIDLAIASRWRRLIRLSTDDARTAEIAANNAQIVFCHSIFRSHNDWVRRFCRSRAIPYIALPHGSLDPWVFGRRRLGKMAWLNAFGQQYLRNAALVMYSSQAERLKAQKTLGFAPPSRVIPWPVDARESSPTESERQAARQRLGFPSAHRILMYFGRYHSMKRPLETAQAFLRAAPHDTMLVMAGFDGDVSAERLLQLAPREPNRLRIHGPLLGAQREDLFIASDAFVSWSHRENFCYSAAEALGFGLPVILSPGNDLRGELHDSACGWFPEDDSLDSLMTVVREFGSMPVDYLRAMGDIGRRHARETFSRSGFALALSEISQTCISL